MKKEELWTGYIILGYILLPFIAIYNLLRNITKEMNEVWVIIFYFFLIIVILQIYSLITYL